MQVTVQWRSQHHLVFNLVCLRFLHHFLVSDFMCNYSFISVTVRQCVTFESDHFWLTCMQSGIFHTETSDVQITSLREVGESELGHLQKKSLEKDKNNILARGLIENIVFIKTRSSLCTCCRKCRRSIYETAKCRWANECMTQMWHFLFWSRTRPLACE